jgi:tetratricopeptide (TPR) repeat protein
MQNVANTSRFLTDFSSERGVADSGIAVSHTKLLRQAVISQLAYTANSRHVFNGLAQRLVQLAEHSFGMRDMDSLREASLVLLNLPTDEARKIGQYYQALAVRRSGKIDESLPLLESVADNAPLAYRARALQTLGAIHHAKGRIDEALRLYPDANRAASPKNGRDLLTTLLVNLDISCIKSEMGDHRGALADYENLSPLVQIVARQNPLYFYLYHNELAIEFAELGRIAEAEAACAVALASPFAAAYPEWSDTRDEIAAKRQAASPSVVAIHQVPEVDRTREADRITEVHRATEADRATKAEPQLKPKPVIKFAFSFPASNKDFFQRSTITVPARAAIALNAVSILDRVLICVGSRAPPSLS